jgi:coenzyme F420 hydrogenase subunit beta
MSRRTVVDAAAAVVADGNCSGCGACTLLDPSLTMRIDDAGFARPAPNGGARSGRAEAKAFDRICPGRRVAANDPEGSTRDAVFGSTFSVWEASATDADIRFRGSSGGALTALASWLLASGRAARVVGAAMRTEAPAVTESLTLAPGDDVVRTAGSRYAPVATVANSDVLHADSAVVAKPCEASALSALHAERGSEPPIILSFFCAGTPSQLATERLVRELGLDPDQLAALRYRGHGWPGRFTAEQHDGQTASVSYDESWGQALGPTMQWRCKVCPDGVGESADIAAGDFWKSDERGYPIFDEGDGTSVLIARSRRGHELIVAALDQGVLRAKPLDVRRLYPVQPLQVERRSTLIGRLAGARLALRPVPRYVGFGLTRLGARTPKTTARAAVGTWLRTVRQRAKSKRGGGR